MSEDIEYDESACITAGELRAAGIAVPENIPDVGWVPRAALRFGPTKAWLDGDTLRTTTELTFDVGFRWVEADVKIEPTPQSGDHSSE